MAKHEDSERCGAGSDEPVEGPLADLVSCPFVLAGRIRRRDAPGASYITSWVQLTEKYRVLDDNYISLARCLRLESYQ